MRTAVRSGQFRRDVKRAEKRGKDMSRLRELILLLLAGEALPERHRDHSLKGNWQSYRDAHIEPDWLLIYRVAGDELHLVRTGTHADPFDEGAPLKAPQAHRETACRLRPARRPATVILRVPNPPPENATSSEPSARTTDAAEVGEVVVTVIAGEGKETESPPAQPGDMVMRNRCPETGNEEILATAAKLVERYEGPVGPADATGWRPCRPRGVEMR